MCSTRWETPVPRRWPSWMLPVRTHAWTLTKGALRSSLTKISNPFGKVAKTAPVGGNSSRDGSWAVPLIGAGAGEWEAVVIPLSTPHASAWPRGNAGRWRPVPWSRPLATWRRGLHPLLSAARRRPGWCPVRTGRGACHRGQSEICRSSTSHRRGRLRPCRSIFGRGGAGRRL